MTSRACASSDWVSAVYPTISVNMTAASFLSDSSDDKGLRSPLFPLQTSYAVVKRHKNRILCEQSNSWKRIDQYSLPTVCREKIIHDKNELDASALISNLQSNMIFANLVLKSSWPGICAAELLFDLHTQSSNNAESIMLFLCFLKSNPEMFLPLSSDLYRRS